MLEQLLLITQDRRTVMDKFHQAVSIGAHNRPTSLVAHQIPKSAETTRASPTEIKKKYIRDGERLLTPGI